MSDRIGLQLYTVRDLAAQDFEGTIRKVADIGYRNVESAGFPGTTPEKAAQLFKDLGLTVVASHSAAPVGEKKNEVIDLMNLLGKPRVIVPWFDPKYFATADGVKQMCESLNEGNANCRAAGLEFGYHNHHAEFGKTEDGQYVYQLMAKYLDPSVIFELDTYWIKVAGLDPAAVVKELGSRAPLLHIKDGPANHSEPMTAVGEGVMDVKSILRAGGDNAKYWIVEMDQVAGDPMVEVRKSYDYLKGIQL